MHCPYCHAEDTKVIDSRLVSRGRQVRRRRACLDCAQRFTTYESIEFILPRVVKRDKTCSAFDQDKLRGGILKALEKRPVTVEQIDAIVYEIIDCLRSSGEREVTSGRIGELVMDKLRVIDPVAYVRFASVYRSFQDVNAFFEEIQRLQDHSKEDDS